jgi:hypothetical protein
MVILPHIITLTDETFLQILLEWEEIAQRLKKLRHKVKYTNKIIGE